MADLDESDRPNSLYHEQKTTSVWSFHGSEPVSITTLDGAGKPDFLNSIAVRVDLNPNDKFLHIQLVKRNSVYTVLVDGLEMAIPRSEPSSDDAVTVYDPCSSVLLQTSGHLTFNIDRYKGIERDPDTSTSVFSPCAVSVLLEDGERPPLQCVVNVKQTLEYNGKTSTGVISSTTIGSQAFEPTRIASSTANAVFTPMPMKFTRPPYAVIFDTSRIETRNALRRLGPAGWIGLANLIASPLVTNMITGAETGAGIWYALTLAVGGLGAPALAAFLSIGAAAYTAGGVLASGAEVARGISSYLSSAPTPEPGKLRLTIDELTRVLVALSAVVSANDIKLSKSNELKNEWLVWGWLQQSEFGNESFALTQFAKDMANAEQALEAAKQAKQAADESGDQQQMETTQQTLNTAQETFDELAGAGTSVDNSAGIAERYFGMSRGTPLVINPIDMTNFNFDSWTAVGIEFDVNIKDAECEDSTYQFVCGQNCILLGAMAFDMRSKIEALWRAISCFESRLEAAAKGDTGAWLSKYFSLTKNKIEIALATATTAKTLYESASKALTEVELRSINAVLNNLDVKLWKTLGGKGRKPGVPMTPEQKKTATQLDRLYDRLLEMEQKTGDFSDPPSDPYTIGIRELPHVVYGKALFPTGEQIELGESNLQTSEAVVKQSSEIKDAITVASRTIRSNSIALRALRDDWERGYSRCRFVHGVEHRLHRTPDETTVNNHYGVLDAVALVLSPPADVLLDSASSSIPEKEQLFQDMVTPQTGWLQMFGGSGHNSYTALAMFAQVLLDEVLKFHSDANTVSAAVNKSIRSLSIRARDRVTACADLLLTITKQEAFGYFHRADPVFIATQPGRDLAMLTRLLHIPDNVDVHVVRRLRSVVQSIRNAAAALYQKIKKDHLLIKRIPYEPLNSMFYCPSDGLRAAYRVNECIALYRPYEFFLSHQARDVLQAAVRGAYPSLQFMDVEWRNEQKMPGPQPNDKWSTENSTDTQKTLKRRLASLRIDPLDTLEGKVEAGCNEDDRDRFVEELSDHFMQVRVSSSISVYSRYSVDFAQGVVVPLRELAQQTPMFGSVPVWTQYLRWGFDQLLEKPTDTDTDFNLIQPVFGRCVSGQPTSVHYGQMKHPSWIIVSASGTSTRRINVFGSVSNQINNKTVFGDDSARLSAAVSSTAWNAERFLQAVLVSAAYDGRKGVCVDVGGIPEDMQKEYLTGVVVGIAMSKALLHEQTPLYFKAINLYERSPIYDRLEWTKTAVSDKVDDQGSVIQPVPTSLRLSEASALLAMCMGIVGM